MKYAALALLFFPLVAFGESSIFVTPDTGLFAPQDVFQVRVMINADEAINAAEAELTYDPSKLRAEAISTTESILKTWVTTPVFDNTEGVVRFSGWTASPFQGNEGRLLAVTFRTLRGSQTEVNLAAGAALAVGQGSNIITTLKSGLYTIDSVGARTREILFADAVDEGGIIAVSQEAASTTDEIASTTESRESGEVSPSVTGIAFTTYDSEITVGDRIQVRGTAPPESRVWVWLERAGEKAQRTEIQTARDGTFSYKSRTMVQGTYRVYAEVHGGGYALAPTETIKITVKPSSLSAAVSVGGNVISIGGSIGLLLFLIAFIYGYWRYKKYRKLEVRN